MKKLTMKTRIKFELNNENTIYQNVCNAIKSVLEENVYF